jgi:hypothetical protein
VSNVTEAAATQPTNPFQPITEQKFNGRTLDEALEEVTRELTVRTRCFPRWVQEGRIGQAESKDRLERLAAAQKFLQILVDSRAWSC